MDASQAQLLEADSLCASESTTRNAYLGLRIGALFGILVVSGFGVFLPMLASARKNAMFLVKAFSGGVIIGTAFVHVLSDANEVLAGACVGWSDYPWAFAIAAAATLLMLVIESYLDKLLSQAVLTRTASSAVTVKPPPALSSPPRASSSTLDSAIIVSVKHADLDGPELDGNGAEERELLRRQYLLRSYSLELGIICHSIFIGIALGVTQDRVTITSLMVALMFHQLNEGLALGMTFVQAQHSVWKYSCLAAVFMVVTPIGVAIGIAVGDERYSTNRDAILSEGILNAVSAGILLHNGLVDVVVPTFAADEAQREPLRVIGCFTLLLGLVTMALIGKWA